MDVQLIVLYVIFKPEAEPVNIIIIQGIFMSAQIYYNEHQRQVDTVNINLVFIYHNIGEQVRSRGPHY